MELTKEKATEVVGVATGDLVRTRGDEPHTLYRVLKVFKYANPKGGSPTYAVHVQQDEDGVGPFIFNAADMVLVEAFVDRTPHDLTTTPKGRCVPCPKRSNAPRVVMLWKTVERRDSRLIGVYADDATGYGVAIDKLIDEADRAGAKVTWSNAAMYAGFETDSIHWAVETRRLDH